jgi:hypothetical protein
MVKGVWAGKQNGPNMAHRQASQGVVSIDLFHQSLLQFTPNMYPWQI